jgi:hypothetical protein
MLNIGKETYCMFGTSMGVEGHLSLVMDLLGIPEPYLGFIKLHAELESLCRKNSPFSHFRWEKKLTKAHVVHLGCIKHLLGFDVSLLGLCFGSMGPVQNRSFPPRH